MSLGILTIVIWVELMVVVYLQYRNEWVYKQQIKLIKEDFDAYNRLPSYNEMLYGHGFWRWDINYYLRKK